MTASTVRERKTAGNPSVQVLCYTPEEKQTFLSLEVSIVVVLGNASSNILKKSQTTINKRNVYYKGYSPGESNTKCSMIIVMTQSIPCQVNLLNMYPLVITCVICLEIEENNFNSFLEYETLNSWTLALLRLVNPRLPYVMHSPNITNAIPIHYTRYVSSCANHSSSNPSHNIPYICTNEGRLGGILISLECYF